MKILFSSNCENHHLQKPLLFDYNSKKEEALLLNKVICVGFSISELRKVLMHNFQHHFH